MGQVRDDKRSGRQRILAVRITLFYTFPAIPDKSGLMAKLVIVAGTPGAGKSSVVDELSKSYNVFGVGPEMLKIGKKLGVVNDQDKIRYLNSKKTAKIKKIVMQELRKIAKNTIIDTPASIRNRNNRYLPGFTVDEIKSLRGVQAIIYIDAKAEEILKRRRKDKSRTRDPDTVDDINEQRDVNIALLTTYSVLFQVPAYIIRNSEGSISTTIKEAKNIVKEAFG